MKRKRILYLGLDPTRYKHDGDLIHCPIIKIVPRPFEAEVKAAFAQFTLYTHVLFTSRTAIQIYIDYAWQAGFAKELIEKTYLCIGKATAEKLECVKLNSSFVAEEETAEGIIALLDKISFKSCHLFFPRSSQGRSLIIDFLVAKKIHCTKLDLYDTQPNPIDLSDLARISHTFSGNSHTLTPDLDRQGSEAVFTQHCPHYPDGQSQARKRRFASKKCEKCGLELFDEIVFTSPSTVKAFFDQFKLKLPIEKCISLGPITKQALQSHFSDN